MHYPAGCRTEQAEGMVADQGAQKIHSGPGHRAAWMAAAGLLALAIFALDAFTPFGIAIAVLYVVVLLLSNQFASRNGLIAIAALCMTLTVAAYLIDHGGERPNDALFRCLISLAALLITTMLLLRGRTTIEALADSEARNRMFLSIPAVSFWRLDVRPLNEIFNALRAAGVTDLKQYADANPDFVIKAMRAATVVDVNDKGVEMFGGKRREDFIGLTALERWPAGKHDVFIRSIAAGFRGESSFQSEARVVRLDGSEFDALFCMASPPEVRARGMVLTAFIDMTEQVQARAALAHMQSDLAHAARLSMLGEFTASIAHEVNQPLAAIAASGEAGLRWLGRAEPEIGEARTLLGRIVGDARRAADIIKRIRNMASKRELAKTRQAINPAIAETVQFVRHELQSHGVEIRLELAPDLPNVEMDRVQIQQVLSNLIVNAMQAMLEHGTVRPHVAITSKLAPDGNIRIEIADNGPGIAADDQERLFDSFFTTKAGGMGLGLPISRSIVAAHGGSIAFENRLEQGACFTITLPSTSREQA
jgi:two-component system sensor kinase FixL